MLPPTTNYKQLQSVIAGSQKMLIAIPAESDIDKLAAGLGLYLSMTKMGKDATIISAQKLTVAESDLIGIDKIKTSLSGRNLVISLDYEEDAIEKVSYNVDNNKFNLVIQPKPQTPPLDPAKVSYYYSGANADLIFLIGISDLSHLGELYQNNQVLFNQTDCVLINNQPATNLPNNIKLSIIDSQANSLSELIVKMLKLTRSNLDTDIATNLLTGIRKVTNNLQNPNTGPLALEAVAVCLRSGAKFDQVKPRVPTAARQEHLITKTVTPLTTPATATPNTPTTTRPPIPPINSSNKAKKVDNNQDGQKDQDGEKTPPPDWLKPKIYRSSD